MTIDQYSPTKASARKSSRLMAMSPVGGVNKYDSLDSLEDSTFRNAAAMTWAAGFNQSPAPTANFMPLESEKNINGDRPMWAHIGRGNDRSVSPLANYEKANERKT